jgi:hypothetical protein
VFLNLKKTVMWLISVCCAILITIFCLANRSDVVIDIWPFPIKQDVQLFALLLACIGIGVLWGGFATWLSGRSSRKETRAAKRMVVAAERDALRAKERCFSLEQDLQDLRARVISNQK